MLIESNQLRQQCRLIPPQRLFVGLFLFLILFSPIIATAQGVIPERPPSESTIESVEAMDAPVDEIATAPEVQSEVAFLAAMITLGVLALVATLMFRRHKGRKLNLETGDAE